jgi:nitrite reductase (NO-forming)
MKISRRERYISLSLIFILVGVLLVACGSRARAPSRPTAVSPAVEHLMNRSGRAASADKAEAAVAAATPAIQEVAAQTAPEQQGPASYTPDVSFTLHTNIGSSGMTFVGVGGDIDGVINPDLQVNAGDVVQITLLDMDGAEHDIALPDFGVTSDRIVGKGASTVIVFRVDGEGAFPYFCTVPGHREAGMEGMLLVGGGAAPEVAAQSDIVRSPTDLPAPIGERAAQTVRIDMQAIEVEGQLADGVTYTYWTFDGQVPGPFLRVRQDDTVELHLTNAADSRMIHSIDLHAVTGPGGGAAVMQIPPDAAGVFTFQALNPGLYVYHCATPMVAHHISNGMYGLILVEPEGGLPPVDREFYVMQGELYTQAPFGQQGSQSFSVEKLLAEAPEYFVFNGAAGGLATMHPLQANVGETVRIFFGVGGPNFTSSFHVIGEIFDRVYDQASLTAPPLTDVQTTLVPPGGATMVEFTLEVPGRYILVDHALSRLERGLVGFLFAEGDENPEVFHEGPAQP